MRKVLLLSVIFIAIIIPLSYANTQTSIEYEYDSNNKLLTVRENGKILYKFTYNKNGSLLKSELFWSPTDLVLTEITSNSALLSWSGNSKATSYVIYQQNENSMIRMPIGETSATSFAITNLIPGGNYSYSVKSYKSDENVYSLHSNAIHLTTNLSLDVYEENDQLSSAYSINKEVRYRAFINHEADVDYYILDSEIISSRLYVMLTVPSMVDYDLYVYNIDGIQIGSSVNTLGVDELFITRYGGPIIIKIIGKSNHYSISAPYTLLLSNNKPGDVGIEPPPVESFAINEGLEQESLFIENEVLQKNNEYNNEYPFDSLNNLFSEVLEERLDSYRFLSEVGLYGDIQWLMNKLSDQLDAEESKEIILVLVKLGYKTIDPIYFSEYLNGILSQINEEGILEDIMTLLFQIIGDESKVDQLIQESQSY